MLPLGAILPVQALNGFIAEGLRTDDVTSTLAQKTIDQIYKDAIVIDGLIIARGWNADSFKALDKSGYTGFNASVDSGNLDRGLKNLEEWRNRIKENPNRLILATSAEDFVRAKKENKTA